MINVFCVICTALRTTKKVYQQLTTAIRAAIEAGEEILKIYNSPFEVEQKEDQSPLTQADKNANAVINNQLQPLGIPIISEENKQVDFSIRKDWKRCWIVDPLDGTKEFIKRNGEFTVNIALAEAGVPVLGVVYAPVPRLLYYADSKIGSYLVKLADLPENPQMEEILEASHKLPLRPLPETYTIVASRSHQSAETDAFINQAEQAFGEVNLVSMGSSLKLCLVAEGTANCYPRLAPTMEWDTAAAHAVAKFAGCEVIAFETRASLHYNKEHLLNPYFLVTRG